MDGQSNHEKLRHAAQRAAKAYAEDITNALRAFAQKHMGEPADQIERTLRQEIAGLDEGHYAPFAESIAAGHTPEMRFIPDQSTSIQVP